MGSLNSDVKVLKIDDAQATAENVVKGVYPISRPFIVATKGEVSEVAQDFINFIMSANGQKVVESNGYIAVENNGVFVSADVSGKIVVAGSSSVSPLMEKLKEAYTAINQNASIEIQQNDSSTGIKAVENDICDIGMSSRELKPAELEKGLNPIYIARDGLAVIVNKESNIDGLTKEQVKSVYLGDVTKWSELK
jgi:phosphate transport system substrate-binding protein